jgi:hypothetical protein
MGLGEERVDAGMTGVAEVQQIARAHERPETSEGRELPEAAR